MTSIAHKTRKEVEALLGSSIQTTHFAPPMSFDDAVVDGCEQQTLHFQGSDGEIIPALLLLPTERKQPVPAILYCHAHGNVYERGMSELFDGTPALQGPYAPALLALGFAVLCIEMPAFGARQEPSESARAKKHLWNGTTLFGQMLDELAAGIAYLTEHPAIDEGRIGVLGFSMGSTHAFWLAALDERVKAAVALCSFADIRCLIDTPAHDGHGIYMTVPGLLREHSTGTVAGLTAPRPLMIGVGMQDWSTPQDCFATARAELETAYRDSPDALVFHVEADTGHEETPAMRQAALSFLERHLCR